MKIRDCYTPNPIILSPDHTVGDVLEAFLRHRVDIACIAGNDGRLAGIVSKYALYRALLDGAGKDTPIRPFIRRSVVTLHIDDSLFRAKDILLENNVGHGVVVDSRERVIGIVGKADIIRGFLKNSELLVNQLTGLIEHLPNAVIATDPDMRIIILNQAAEQMFDISREAIIGTSIDESFPELSSDLRKTMRERSPLSPRRYKLRQHTVMASFVPIAYIDGTGGAMAVLQDLTALEAIAQELETTKNLQHTLQQAVAQSYDGMAITDRHGRILVANEAFSELFGCRREEITGRDWSDILPECPLDPALAGKKIQREVRTVRGKTCIIVQEPVLRSGQPLGVIAKFIFHELDQWLNVFRRIEQLENELDYYKDQYRRMAHPASAFDTIVSMDPAMETLKRQAALAARSSSTVLITGESGTGKELFAEAIHRESGRPGPFVRVNCAAIPAELLESEFFGYAEGAFTGARRGGKPGKFELADGGTLFLDEIGDMPLPLQAKLLRVLQDQSFERVGDVKPRKVDVRIIAATNKDLEEMVRKGTFREDLYYRIHVVHLHIPPLRERPDDIPVLCEHLVKKLNKKLNKEVLGVTPQALSLLKRFAWPGNIRQLENVLERAMNLDARRWIEPRHLPEEIRNASAPRPKSDFSPAEKQEPAAYQQSMKAWERECILQALSKTGGNRSAAARLLGISRSTLYHKMRKLGIKTKVSFSAESR